MGAQRTYKLTPCPLNIPLRSAFQPRLSRASQDQGRVEEEAAAGPAGKWQSARHQKGWQSINPTVRNKQRSVSTFHSIGHLSLRMFESSSIREQLDRMSGMVSTCPSSTPEQTSRLSPTRTQLSALETQNFV